MCLCLSSGAFSLEFAVTGFLQTIKLAISIYCRRLKSEAVINAFISTLGKASNRLNTDKLAVRSTFADKANKRCSALNFLVRDPGDRQE